MSNKSFFNTVNLSGEKLERAKARALSQENLIKEIFMANPDKKISPSQMLQIFSKKYDLHPPIVSIRRAMTSLTYSQKGMVLRKTEEQAMGSYGVPEYLWELNKLSSDEELQAFWDEHQKETWEDLNNKPGFVQGQMF
jgi:hypothetical protein